MRGFLIIELTASSPAAKTSPGHRRRKPRLQSVIGTMLHRPGGKLRIFFSACDSIACPSAFRFSEYDTLTNGCFDATQLCCVEKGQTSEQGLGAIFRRFQFPVPVRGLRSSGAWGGVCGVFLLPLPACHQGFYARLQRGRGEGPLHKGGLAESEGAFPRSSDSRRGTSPGICAKSAQIPASGQS